MVVQISQALVKEWLKNNVLLDHLMLVVENVGGKIINVLLKLA